MRLVPPPKQLKAKPLKLIRDNLRQAQAVYERASQHDHVVSGHYHWELSFKGLLDAGHVPRLAFGARRGFVTGRLIGDRADCLILPLSELESRKFCGIHCTGSNGTTEVIGESGVFVFGDELDGSLPVFITDTFSTSIRAPLELGPVLIVCAMTSRGRERAASHYQELGRDVQLIDSEPECREVA